jgi:hypothetical protein
MGKDEIEAFLTHLAVNGNMAASTQSQELGPIRLLYHEFLHTQ